MPGNQHFKPPALALPYSFPYPDDPDIARFLSSIEPYREDGCWQWIGRTRDDGYGLFSIRRHRMLAHRFAYEWLVGQIPTDTLDHLCRNPSCVNPSHLEPVSRGENVLRGRSIPAANRAKTRCPQGHPYDEENTYWTATGGRQCKACIRAASSRRALQAKEGKRLAKLAIRELEFAEIQRVRPDLPAECGNGHVFDAWNTFMDRQGNITCRRCRADAVNRWYAKKKENNA
jgi:HNH endonuclease